MSEHAEIHAKYSARQKVGLFLALPVFLAIYFLPFNASLSPMARSVLAAAVMMATLWITEAIPIPATALLPLVLFPLLKVEVFAEVAKNYAHSNIFLFMGGFFLAISMQKWGLHRRIALRLILLIGSSPRRIILGFMVATAFLSMWISNTATTMMMYPIGLAIILHLTESAQQRGEDQIEVGGEHFRTALMLAIAYAASVGGIGTLIGTPPNIVFAAALSKLYPEAPEVSFVQWLGVGIPLVLVFIPLIYFFLTRVAFRIGSDRQDSGDEVIREELAKLGPMTRPEKTVAVVFLLTALAWLSRADLKIGSHVLHGWASTLGVSGYVNDATVAMLAALVLFILPAKLSEGEFTLDWNSAVSIPWGILILFGGGIALADAFKVSGLAEWSGQQLALFGKAPLPVLIILTSLVVVVVTEFTSNTATSTLFMPILASLSGALHVHPFLLMIPAAVSASCAFMLPVATPPNAIVFASGYITIPQMAKTGFLINLVGAVLVLLLTYLVVVPLFGISFNELPLWAQ